jgi:hypothetical protein
MTGRPADRQAAAGRGYPRLPRGRAPEWPPLEPPELPPEERGREPPSPPPELPPDERGRALPEPPTELPPPPLLRGR